MGLAFANAGGTVIVGTDPTGGGGVTGKSTGLAPLNESSAQ